MNKLVLKKTVVQNKKIIYSFDVEGKWKKFFKNRKKYFIEYEYELSHLPISIANIPFVLNLIPLVWLFDAEFELPSLDKNCYDSLHKIKQGYINMYPKLSFKGHINCNIIEKNHITKSGNVGMFFSGGLDATSTLASHYKEKPLLINIQGSDISLYFNKVLLEVQSYLKKVSHDYGLDITFVKSEFRNVIHEKKITKYMYDIVKDNYWHAFQHGIAIIGHSAPICFLEKLDLIYIGASYTKETLRPCASDPTIDNFVQMATSRVVHDGFDKDRNAKSENVMQYHKETKHSIQLRVCLDDYRTYNCCRCEKCYRTILNFASKGYDPELAGFYLSNEDYKTMKDEIINKIIIPASCITLWEGIQKEFYKNNYFKNDIRFSWIYDIDFKTINDKRSKKFVKIYRKYIRRFKKLVVLINNMLSW